MPMSVCTGRRITPNVSSISLSIIFQEEIKINKLIAQKDIRFSNSMIEAVNKRMKYDFLFRHQLLDFEHTQRFLDTAVEQYNNRPHTALFGLTPREVFHGANPDKNLFKDQIKHAKTVRKAENKALACHYLFSISSTFQRTPLVLYVFSISLTISIGPNIWTAFFDFTALFAEQRNS